SAHLRQCGADDNQIDQDELFDCHVNNSLRELVMALRQPGQLLPELPQGDGNGAQERLGCLT
ncbi:hypothetical protein, partial [Halomonas cupida]|uniref:hypothetical protein n=1 Tax=Halomonas cupida TaxID=44933 RepID=UPI003A923B66